MNFAVPCFSHFHIYRRFRQYTRDVVAVGKEQTILAMLELHSWLTLAKLT
jgi:hypothetical protein